MEGLSSLIAGCDRSFAVVAFVAFLTFLRPIAIRVRLGAIRNWKIAGRMDGYGAWIVDLRAVEADALSLF